MKLAVVLGLLVLITLISVPTFSRGDDLDDGIPIDDSLMEYDQIGDSVEPNYSYIALRAQSDAAGRSDEQVDGLISDQGSLVNSVILEAGSSVQGDIVIIDQSRGDKTIIDN
ncbi:MAG TPA: hypothetical protein ENK84_04570 [Desulfobulbus sp.]|nr:hypothetical protein [Desulfobulbus sp.]